MRNFLNLKKRNKVATVTDSSQQWFGLSYASWLVLPRVALQSMPLEWQSRFFKMVEELEETLEYPEGYTGEFAVTMKRDNKYVKDVMPHYRHNVLPMKKREGNGK